MHCSRALHHVFGMAVGLSSLTVLASCSVASTRNESTSDEPVALAEEACTRMARSISVTPIGRYSAGIVDADRGAAEIVAYDAGTRRLFVVNLNQVQLDVLDVSNPSSPRLVATLPTTGDPNSVAVSRGVVAVASSAVTKTDPGQVQFYDAESLELVGEVTVGAKPDMITYSPDGKLLLVANEGEPDDEYVVDPPGSVSIVRIPWAIDRIGQDDVTTVGFDDGIPLTNSDSIRLFGHNETLELNLEPEYIAVSRDGKMAWVTLQENNAIAALDLRERRFVGITGLGYKDHMRPGNGLDASDKDGMIHIANWPVYGIYEPDGIAAIQRGRQTFLVTANEGDAREWGDVVEEVRLAKAPHLDPEIQTLAADNTKLGRLSVSSYGGVDLDGDGDIDRPLALGARSFSVWNEWGTQVFDSGDEIEQTIASLVPMGFNSNNDETPSFDKRSAKKGPEPEGLVVASLYGKPYLFLGLERDSGILVYDLSNPIQPSLVHYVNDRDFAATTLETAGDLGPEGLVVVSERESPTGTPLLIVSNEVSGTVRFYEIAPEP